MRKNKGPEIIPELGGFDPPEGKNKEGIIDFSKVRERLKEEGVSPWLPVRVFHSGWLRRIESRVYSIKSPKYSNSVLMAVIDNLHFDIEKKTWYSRSAWSVRDLMILRWLIDKTIDYITQRDNGMIAYSQEYGEEALVELYKARKEPGMEYEGRYRDRKDKKTEKTLAEIRKQVQVDATTEKILSAVDKSDEGSSYDPILDEGDFSGPEEDKGR